GNRRGVLKNIRVKDNNTTRRCMRELQRLVYPTGHPYRKDRFGTAETVKVLERSDVKDYFENVISQAPTLIAFAGQFKKDEVVSGPLELSRQEARKRSTRKRTLQRIQFQKARRERS